MQSNNNTGMSTAARQQQRDCNREKHAEARARLTEQEWQQQRDRHREQNVEARARLTEQEQQQQRDRDREWHQSARGQLDLHTATCVPLSEFDEPSVPMLNIGGRTTECQQCRAMIWPDEAFR
jgi:hypothetical protein